MDANEIMFSRIGLVNISADNSPELKTERYENKIVPEPKNQLRMRSMSNPYLIRSQLARLQWYKLPDQIRVDKLRRKLRRTDFLAAYIAAISMVIIQYSSELFYLNDNESTPEISSLRGLNAILSLILAKYIIDHHRQNYNLKLELKERNVNISFWQSDERWPWIFKLCVMCVFTPPYLDYEFEGEMLNGTYVYSIDNIISCIAMSRLFIFMNLYVHLRSWNKKDVRMLDNDDQCHALAKNFTIKFELRFNPWTMLVIMVVILIWFTGFNFRNLERSYESESQNSLNLEYWSNGVWLSFTSLTSVGYGDGYPSTHLGRFMTCLLGIAGLWFESLFIITFYRKTKMTEKEEKAYYLIKNADEINPLKSYAADVIKTAFQLRAMQVARPQFKVFITTRFDRVYTPKLKRFAMYQAHLRNWYLPSALKLDGIRKDLILKQNWMGRGQENLPKASEKINKLREHCAKQNIKIKEIDSQSQQIEKEMLSLVNHIGSETQGIESLELSPIISQNDSRFLS